MRNPESEEVAHPEPASHVPSIGLVVAGDAVYNGVRLYLVESGIGRLQK